MQGILSFHPVDPDFFQGLIEPLVAGRKVNPEEYLDAARACRVPAWRTSQYVHLLESLRLEMSPPPPAPDASRWQKARAWMERIDHRPGPLVKAVARAVDPDLHLRGRPFFVTEDSPEKVASVVDDYLGAGTPAAVDLLVRGQLSRLDPDLAEQVRLDADQGSGWDGADRAALLDRLRGVRDLARAALVGETWSDRGGRPEAAREVLSRELPWRAVSLHSRAAPFWIARDVDGLGELCRAAGVESPDCLIPAWCLFPAACETFPRLQEALTMDVRRPGDVGGYVPPGRVEELLEFLACCGAVIIRAATRAGEGPACSMLLKKIRECARYALRRGRGYLEASGIVPAGVEEREDGRMR